nr:hypothetical protein [Escherichia coli]
MLIFSTSLDDRNARLPPALVFSQVLRRSTISCGDPMICLPPHQPQQMSVWPLPLLEPADSSFFLPYQLQA